MVSGMQAVFQAFNGFAPRGTIKGMPLSFDFGGAVASYLVDLTTAENFSQLEFVQQIWVDNADNDAELTITSEITGQRIIVPPNSQGVFPFIEPNPQKFTVATAVAEELEVHLILLNVPMPDFVWNVQGAGGSSSPFVTGSYTDYSGTIAVGGTSQAAIAANANRKKVIIQNPSTENEVLYVNFGAAAGAGDSFEILPGGSYTEGGAQVSTQEIQVNAATGGHVFVAKEM
jgi:hypothetical protein